MFNVSQENYLKYRGKCKEMSESLCREDSTLTLVRGFYYCPVLNREEQHWWCKRQSGEIVDPTAKQFPSAGFGEYREFNGFYECDFCQKSVHERFALFESRFAFCCYTCVVEYVGTDYTFRYAARRKMDLISTRLYKRNAPGAVFLPNTLFRRSSIHEES